MATVTEALDISEIVYLAGNFVLSTFDPHG